VSERISNILKNDLGVEESYQHAPKRVTATARQAPGE
jgi:hypothetical protein